MATDFSRLSITASHLKFTVRGTEYQWGGGFGANFYSYENGLSQGMVRSIGGIMFEIFAIRRKWFRKDEVCWCCVENLTAEDLRDLKKSIFR